MKSAIVICGQIASGKSTVARFIACKLAVRTVSFGDFVRHIASQDSQPMDRANLQDLGNTLYRRLGPDGLLDGALRVAGAVDLEIVVIDGVRHSSMLAEIRWQFDNTIAIYLDVCEELRFKRYRSRSSCSCSYEEFKSVESHAVEAEIDSLAEQCDFVVDASKSAVEVQDELPNRIYALRDNRTSD